MTCCCCCLCHVSRLSCCLWQTAADVLGQRRSNGRATAQSGKCTSQGPQTAERRSRKRKERERRGKWDAARFQSSKRFRLFSNIKARTGQGSFARDLLYLGAGRVRAPKVPASPSTARSDTSLACVSTRSGNASDLAFRWMRPGEQKQRDGFGRATRSGAMQTKLRYLIQVRSGQVRYGAELRLARTRYHGFLALHAIRCLDLIQRGKVT